MEMVPSEGLEPPRREALGSKPSVATNYTNWARGKAFLGGKLEQVKLAIRNRLREFPTYRRSAFYSLARASS